MDIGNLTARLQQLSLQSNAIFSINGGRNGWDAREGTIRAGKISDGV